MFDTDRPTGRPRARSAGFALAAAVLLAGCSSMDPTGLLDSETVQPERTAQPEQADGGTGQAEAEFPQLGEVPEEPERRPSTRAERAALQDRLSADRANARYTDQTLRAPEAAPEQPDTGAARESAPDMGSPAAGTKTPRAETRGAETQADKTQAATAPGDSGARAAASGAAETASAGGPSGGGETATPSRNEAAASADAQPPSGRAPSGGAGTGTGAPEADTGTEPADSAEMPEVPPAPSELTDRDSASAADPSGAASAGGDTQAQPGREAEQAGASRASAPEPAQAGQETAQPQPQAERRAEPDTAQTARTASNGAAGNAPTVEINRSQIPQMRPSRQGEPVQLPTRVRRQMGARTAPAEAKSRDVAAQRQQTARLQTPPASPSQVEPRADAGGPGQQLAVIYFGHAGAGLDREDRQVLDKVAGLYDKHGGGLRVVGHASSRTATMDMIQHRMVNLDISMRRAENVADALVEAGVPRGEITVEARADRDPAYHEFMPTGEAGNRRAEIFLTK